MNVCARKVAIVGAGVAGLVAALELSGQGLDVSIYERGPRPGGKMREIEVGSARIDSGPTVLTMKWVFDEIFAAAGTSLEAHLRLHPLRILARHAWSSHERLDLYADLDATIDAIGRFANRAEAQRYRDFHATARDVYQALETPFIRAARPTVAGMIYNTRLDQLPTLLKIEPHASLWRQLARQFQDPRLRQLFGRYATYCGSSPYQSPATLMLISHVEQQGVWGVEGGMQRLAEALASLAEARGVKIICNGGVKEIVVQRGRATGLILADGEHLSADAIVVNADAAALAGGLFGAQAASATPSVAPSQRSMSALTWSLLASADGFPLARHNVFFGRNYAAEFHQIFNERKLPSDPTVYVCAQDQGLAAEQDPGATGHTPSAPREQRLFVLVNAPAHADSSPLSHEEIAKCEERTFEGLRRCGLQIRRLPERTALTAPADFHRLFPATGGALYGQASHGWMASFQRPGSRSRIPNLYLAGGSTHPGPGLPMAAISGRHAAAAILSDLHSMRRFQPVATVGGTSTP